MLSRKIKLLFSGLAVATLLVSTIPFTPVSAEPTVSYDMPTKNITTDWTSEQRIQSVLYMRSLAVCMNESLQHVESRRADEFSLSVTKAPSLQEWADKGLLGGKNPVGAMLDPQGDATLACSNEGGWLDKALKLWQFDSKIEALCTFGWFRTIKGEALTPTKAGTYDDCINGEGQTLLNAYSVTTADGMITTKASTSPSLFLSRMAYARGLTTGLSGADVYLLYLGTFTAQSGCTARQVIRQDKATADQNAIPADKKAIINIVEQAPPVEGQDPSYISVPYIYQLDTKNMGDAAKIAPYTPPALANGDSPHTDGGNSCKYISEIINKYTVNFIDAAINGDADASDITDVIGGGNACIPDASGACATKTCGVEGIGWIVCPVFNFLAGMADGAYALIESLLVTNIKLVDIESTTYTAWQVMRNIGNAGFVIAFLIIVFSQLTGAGISNYGVKKLLPRLIVTAILVNISFFVAQIAVDISNVLGSSLKALMDNISLFNSTFISEDAAKGNLFSNITGGILAAQGVILGAAGVTAAIYFGGIALLIPIILAAVVAIVMTLFILVARQALVVLLVVISPIAFLAMLLPNTENLFKQWRKIFIAMLILYPAVGLLFGASKLASTIMINAMGSDTTAQLVALAVLILPLFALPAILKGSLNAIPAIGNLAQKLTNSATAGTRKGAGAGMKELGQRAASGKSRFSQFASRGIYGRGREGRSRQASARRAFEEPRIKDIQERWANDGMMNDASKLMGEIDQHGFESLEGQAAIGRLAQMGNAGDLAKYRDIAYKKSLAGDGGALAAYDKATAPHFAALKAKDYRSVFSGSALSSKYGGIKANEMHGMTDDALSAGYSSNENFKQTMLEALADPEQGKHFSVETKKAYAKQVAEFIASRGGAAPAEVAGPVAVPEAPAPTPTPTSGGSGPGGLILPGDKEFKIR